MGNREFTLQTYVSQSLTLSLMVSVNQIVQMFYPYQVKSLINWCVDYFLGDGREREPEESA